MSDFPAVSVFCYRAKPRSLFKTPSLVVLQTGGSATSSSPPESPRTSFESVTTTSTQWPKPGFLLRSKSDFHHRNSASLDARESSQNGTTLRKAHRFGFCREHRAVLVQRESRLHSAVKPSGKTAVQVLKSLVTEAGNLGPLQRRVQHCFTVSERCVWSLQVRYGLLILRWLTASSLTADKVGNPT